MGRSIYCENCNDLIYKYVFGLQESDLEYLSSDFGIGRITGKDEAGVYLTLDRDDLDSLKIFYLNEVKPKLADHLLKALALDQSGLEGGIFNEDLDFVDYNPNSPFGKEYKKFLAETDTLFFLMADAIYKHTIHELKKSDAVTFFGQYV